MSKVFYDKPIIEQIFEEFYKGKEDRDLEKLIKLVKRLPPEDVNKYDKYDQTLLILASKYGYTEIVKLLLDYENIDIHKKDIFGRGRSALLLASRYGHIDIVRLLLGKKDINVNTRYFYGEALFHASHFEHTEIVKLLLEKEDIDINIINSIGQNPLMIAREKGYTEIVELLENYQKN